MAIDVGSAAIDRAGNSDLSDYTFIAAENPANESGTINHIEVYIYSDTGTIEVASFYKTNGNTFSTRGSTGVLEVEVGLNVYNAPGDFTAFDINIGDYIGIHGVGSTIRIEQDSSGDGKWYKPGDYIPCTDTLFSWLVDRTISLYATGGVTGYTISVGSGSFTLTGQILNLLKGFKILISSGVFDWVGFSVTLTKGAVGYTITIEAGEFTETGQVVALLKGFNVIIESGTFNWTGFIAVLISSGFKIDAATGEYIIAGFPVLIRLKQGEWTIKRRPTDGWVEETKPSDGWEEETKPEDNWNEEEKPGG